MPLKKNLLRPCPEEKKHGSSAVKSPGSHCMAVKCSGKKKSQSLAMQMVVMLAAPTGRTRFPEGWSFRRKEHGKFLNQDEQEREEKGKRKERTERRGRGRREEEKGKEEEGKKEEGEDKEEKKEGGKEEGKRKR